jgi:hypothetical protein
MTNVVRHYAWGSATVIPHRQAEDVAHQAAALGSAVATAVLVH